MTNYCFVLDASGKQLAPTKEQKAWFLIRKKRATLVSKYPMVIKLTKIINEKEINKDEVRCGIDDVIDENYISFSDGHSTKRIHKELTQIVDIYVLDMNKFNELYIKLIDIGLKINMLEKINQEEYLKINFENIINIKQKEENK